MRRDSKRFLLYVHASLNGKQRYIKQQEGYLDEHKDENQRQKHESHRRKDTRGPRRSLASWLRGRGFSTVHIFAFGVFSGGGGTVIERNGR